MYTCTWDFLMKTRLLVHYLDGKTFTGRWDYKYDFKKLSNKPISSLQIQRNDLKMYTLSSKRKQSNTFWQRDHIKNKELVARSILKRLNKDIWLDMYINCDTGKRNITIIREEIKVK